MLMCFAVVPAKPKDTICARDSYTEDNREIQRIDRALPQDDMKFVRFRALNSQFLFAVAALLAKA